MFNFKVILKGGFCSAYSTLLLLSLTQIASGTPTDTGSCNVSSFTLNSILTTDGNNTQVLLNGPVNATSCVGAFSPNGNDDGGLSSPNPNTGILDVGLLNGEGDFFDGMEFITVDDLQDIDGIGGNNDPGWIHLAHMNEGLSVSYDSIGSLNLDQILDISFGCTGTSGDCKAGTWELAVSPSAISILEGSTFDHLALAIKASNEFSVYDFDFLQIIANGHLPTLEFDQAYVFSGTFISADHGVSHMNLWARDPAAVPGDVPEPSILFIFGLSLLGLAIASRRSVLIKNSLG